MSGMTAFHVVTMLSVLEGGIKFRNVDTQIPRTDHVERSLNVFGCRFGSRCYSPPWRTEQNQNELPVPVLENVIETAVLVVDSNQSLSNIFPILGKGEIFKRFVASLDIEIRPPSGSATKQVRNVQYTQALFRTHATHPTHKAITLDGSRYVEYIPILELTRDDWLFSPGLEDGKVFY